MMKNFKYSIAYLAIVALLFTSCSKDEASDVASPDIQDTFQLQFGALLNDFADQNKDHLSDDPVECSDTELSYVLVALTDINGNWVAGKNPEAVGADESDFIRLNLKDNNGSWETEFSEELGLPAGTYFLDYFIVYSASDEVLWVAPREDGAYASSVSDPLPQTIVLGAGTKPYVLVDVLCFIPRNEEAFGYLFFDINAITVENNYCLFVNFCDDGTGREYPALFQVDIWADDFGGSDVVIGGETNTVSGSGNDFAATVLCLPLPPLGEGEVYYVRVTVLDAGAYDAGASDVVEYTIAQADIAGQPSQVPAYEHIRVNCDDDGGNGNGGDPCDSDPSGAQCDPDDDGLTNAEESDLGTDPNDDDSDDDGVIDGDDNCPLEVVFEGQVDPDRDGCWTDPVAGCTPTSCTMSTSPSDLCYFTVVDLDTPDDFYQVSTGPSPASFDLEGDRGLEIVTLGTYTAEVVDGEVIIQIDGALETDQIKAYEVQVRPNDGNGNMSSSCFHTLCASDITPTQGNQPAINLNFNDVEYEYPIFVRVKAIICEEEVAGP